MPLVKQMFVANSSNNHIMDRGTMFAYVQNALPISFLTREENSRGKRKTISQNFKETFFKC